MKRSFFPSARLRNNLRVSLVYWLALCGIGIWVALVAARLIPGAPSIELHPFLVVLALAVINLSARSYERLYRDQQGDGYRRIVISWVFVAADLILVAVGLRLTGGVSSPLWVILFLIGVAETVLAPAPEAYLIRYGVILSLVLGTIPYPLHQLNSAYLVEIVLRTGCIAAVTSVARRLRTNKEAQEAENASLRAELTLAQERSHLSREVHDGVGNSLAAAVLRLEFAARKSEKEGNLEAAPIFREEAQALRETMTAVRDWTFYTRPWAAPDDATQSLSSAFLHEVDRLSRRTGLAMQVENAELLDQLPLPLQLAVLRIVQEGLTNAAKHAAGATRAEVRMYRERNAIIISIADDGSGFDPKDKGTGVGMSSMRERAEGLGGQLMVDAAPGLGTTLTARLPVL